MTKKTSFIILVAIAVTALGVYLITNLTGDESPSTFDEVLAQVADETNKTLPMLIDRETRLDATAAGAGKRFIYSYTLINYVKGEVDTSALRARMQPTLIANYKSNPQMKDFRDEGVELHYQYKDKNGEFLLEIVVNPSGF